MNTNITLPAAAFALALLSGCVSRSTVERMVADARRDTMAQCVPSKDFDRLEKRTRSADDTALRLRKRLQNAERRIAALERETKRLQALRVDREREDPKPSRSIEPPSSALPKTIEITAPTNSGTRP